MRLDTRLRRLESRIEEIAARRGRHDQWRAAETWARSLHPIAFERFDNFFGDFSAKHPGLSWREELIEASKDSRAVELARQQTELIVAQFVSRSAELQ